MRKYKVEYLTISVQGIDFFNSRVAELTKEGFLPFFAVVVNIIYEKDEDFWVYTQQFSKSTEIINNEQ